MTRYIVEMFLVLEAESREEADKIADKLVNQDLPEEIHRKIVRWSYTKPLTEEEYELGYLP